MKQVNNDFELIQMSFDGDYVRDSKHATIEHAWNTQNDLGGKWFFYPFPLIVKGQTVKEAGGSFVNMATGKIILNTLLKGKRFKTVQNIFKTVSQFEHLQGADCEQFEDELIMYLKSQNIK